MIKRETQILTRWLQQSSTGPGPYPEPYAGIFEPRRPHPSGPRSSVAMREPDPELLVRVVRQARRTR